MVKLKEMSSFWLVVCHLYGEYFSIVSYKDKHVMDIIHFLVLFSVANKQKYIFASTFSTFY